MKIKLILKIAYLLIILALMWSAWTEWGWGEETKTVVFVVIATKQEQQRFFKTHPNCWPIERLGDLIKIECEVVK